MEVKQMAQIHSIGLALELFNSEFEGYPDSDALDPIGQPYCGSMKLCEAMMGQDLKGFHPDSIFRSDGTDYKGDVLYPDPPPPDVISEKHTNNWAVRKGPYLPLDNANAFALVDLYGQGNTGPFDPNHLVLCDVSRRVVNFSTGKKIGMPILYYRAYTFKTAHDIDNPNNPENIYDYRDNHALLALGVPGKPGRKHPLYEDPKIFYQMTRDHKSGKLSRPQRADSYILLSAGYDGLYGTEDDVANFETR